MKAVEIIITENTGELPKSKIKTVNSFDSPLQKFQNYYVISGIYTYEIFAN